ncbi:DNA repair protein [Micromonospora sp. NPDC005806]|uniref:DNA repair protein n=1 Tax=Micromonospora sp. NPDC005806 TaxID=3364234 RepID=UPI0036C8D6B2
MPNQPNDRYQQDTESVWPAADDPGRFPAQSRYREARAGGPLSWAELNALPAGTATRDGLNTR